MTYKDTGMFNMPHRRGCDTVKLVFSAYEITKKPIKYWANIGTVNKKGSFYKIISLVKKITGDFTGNGITYLAYYGGSRLLFPFQLNYHGNSFELCVYNCFGENPIVISRKIKSDNERLTKEDEEQINDFLRLQYHIVWDGFNFIKEYVKEAKNYTDVRLRIKELKEKINS